VNVTLNLERLLVVDGAEPAYLHLLRLRRQRRHVAAAGLRQ
jgi:hypothetical protein